MESSQVVCSSPPFCKLEPESPPSWDTVDFTESNFGEYWPDDWEDEKESVDIKSFSHSDDLLLDLDLLMKEEPFAWIDERNDGLYTSSFDWSPSDIKVFNNSVSSTSPTITFNQKPSFIGVTTSSVTTATATAPPVIENVAVTIRSAPIGGKIFHHNNHHLQNLATITNNTSPTSIVAATAAATPDLLREFEDVLISTTTGSLTPPESPRDQSTSLITLLQEIEPCTSSSNEIDAIVATQAENMVPQDSDHPQHQLQQHQQQQQQPPSSPDPWSSPSMGSSSSCSDSGYDDPDWSPSSPPVQSTTGSSSNNTTSTNNSLTSTRRKRSAATTTEERKLRKKEQNKNAATRYRQKKKQEIEVIIGEERELLETHERLKADVTEITREIRYLKSLLRDLYKAKGLIS
uniref:Putative activating transcription factor 4 n=1 Tax=Triatoma infestans TaxID=30076 RepID=A0A023F7I1_TRIIF